MVYNPSDFHYGSITTTRKYLLAHLHSTEDAPVSISRDTWVHHILFIHKFAHTGNLKPHRQITLTFAQSRFQEENYYFFFSL